MAEYDPAQSGGSWDGEEEYDVAEGNQQDGSEDGSEHSDQDEAQYSLNSAPHASGDSSSPDGAGGDAGNVGDYDPASLVSASPSASSTPRSSSQRPLLPSHLPQPAAKKPKTAGGFLVGDSDSEDDDTPSSNGGAAALKPHSALRASMDASLC